MIYYLLFFFFQVKYIWITCCREKIEHLKLIITDPKTNLDPDAKVKAENNLKEALNDLINTRAFFSLEKLNSSVAEKYSKKFEESKKTLTVSSIIY